MSLLRAMVLGIVLGCSLFAGYQFFQSGTQHEAIPARHKPVGTSHTIDSTSMMKLNGQLRESVRESGGRTTVTIKTRESSGTQPDLATIQAIEQQKARQNRWKQKNNAGEVGVSTSGREAIQSTDNSKKFVDGPVAADPTTTTTTTTAMKDDSSMTTKNTDHTSDSRPRHDSKIQPDPKTTACKLFLETYKVIPGSSWGTLSTEDQRKWGMMNCDKRLSEQMNSIAAAVDAEKLQQAMKTVAFQEGGKASGAAFPVKKSNHFSWGKKDKKDKKSSAAGVPKVNKDRREWCHDAKERYGVIPLRSWGRLPLNYVDSWKDRKCDLVFMADRMSGKPISRCLNSASSSTGSSTSSSSSSSVPSLAGGAVTDAGVSNSTQSSSSKSGGGLFGFSSSKSDKSPHPNMADNLPLIAVMAATTTRKVHKPSTKTLSLFTYLLPSLVRSLDCGYRYEYVLGYDKGDPFYDSKEGMAEVKLWFKDNVENPMKKNGIKVTLRLVKVNNTLKKPGPVFLEMARAAYKAGADYFYRINDDTELLVNWADKFVRGVNSLGTPLGVVGPTCSQGNDRILTHDFTARLHMDIFEMNYYPPELTDWWMDDWISLVYGRKRTFKAVHVPVMHHTGSHGTRYSVDSGNAGRLTSLVQRGRQQIRQWMLTHNVPEATLKEFDGDVYSNFKHIDLPKNI